MKQRAFDVLGNVAVVNFHNFNQTRRFGKSATTPHPPNRDENETRIKSARRKKISVKEKKKFAEKILKENKFVKTVLEKVGRVKGRLRKPTTRYIAGEKTKEVLYRENNCVFRFNVDTTYFSPRLSNERKEIAKKIKKGENVLVMFAGVAPFSIVIAKTLKNRERFLAPRNRKPKISLDSKAKKVVSVEINREASKYAKLNVELNKVKNRVEVVQGNVKKVFKGRLSEGNRRCPRFDVIVMPRPQLKESFLKQAFALSKKGTRVYYYDFCEQDKINLIVEKIKQEALKNKKKIKILNIKEAGEIAPYKVRVRVDFKIL